MVTPDELVPRPHEFVLQHGVPDTIAGWKELVCGLLTDQACAFHRNYSLTRGVRQVLHAQAWPRITPSTTAGAGS